MNQNQEFSHKSSFLGINKLFILLVLLGSLFIYQDFSFSKTGTFRKLFIDDLENSLAIEENKESKNNIVSIALFFVIFLFLIAGFVFYSLFVFQKESSFFHSLTLKEQEEEQEEGQEELDFLDKKNKIEGDLNEEKIKDKELEEKEQFVRKANPTTNILNPKIYDFFDRDCVDPILEKYGINCDVLKKEDFFLYRSLKEMIIYQINKNFGRNVNKAFLEEKDKDFTNNAAYKENAGKLIVEFFEAIHPNIFNNGKNELNNDDFKGKFKTNKRGFPVFKKNSKDKGKNFYYYDYSENFFFNDHDFSKHNDTYKKNVIFKELGLDEEDTEGINFYEKLWVKNENVNKKDLSLNHSLNNININKVDDNDVEVEIKVKKIIQKIKEIIGNICYFDAVDFKKAKDLDSLKKITKDEIERLYDFIEVGWMKSKEEIFNEIDKKDGKDDIKKLYKESVLKIIEKNMKADIKKIIISVITRFFFKIMFKNRNNEERKKIKGLSFKIKTKEKEFFGPIRLPYRIDSGEKFEFNNEEYDDNLRDKKEIYFKKNDFDEMERQMDLNIQTIKETLSNLNYFNDEIKEVSDGK